MRKKGIFLLLLIISVFNLTSCSNEIIEEKKNIGLYPAYKKEGNRKLWGYIDESGTFVIEPKFDFTEGFNKNGLGKIYLKGKMGFVDKEGEVVLSPEYKNIDEIEEGVFSAVKENEYYIFDDKGEKLFNSDEYMFLGMSSEGYIAAAKEIKDDDVKMGYINKNGEVLIEPKYRTAWDFKNGRALVQTMDDKNLIINKNDEIIKEIKYENISPDEKNETFLFCDENDLFGYLDVNGEVLIEPQFTNAFHFKDGMAIISITDISKGIEKWGVIDKKGNFIFEPDFAYISYLGQGLFSVSKDEIGDNEIYLRKAIMTKNRKQLTDFEYYNIGGTEETTIDGKYISVSDGKKTFFLDMEGKEVSEFPKVDGFGEVSLKGNLIKAFVDDRLSYYNREGKIVWTEDKK